MVAFQFHVVLLKKPSLHLQPPAQGLVARDLHDKLWTFRHIYGGQPKRHLLTTDWSVFSSSKRLLAGDSVIFLRDEKGQLLLGIRHANRQSTSMSLSILSSDSMQIGVLAAAAAHAAINQIPFTVFYNPRTSLSEFVVPSTKYNKALYGTQVSIGMCFRMMFESEESSVYRAGADDKPLRMVKTVLHELVKIRGTAIKGHLSMVPIDVEPQPIILAYIDLNLQTLAAARMLAPSGTGQAQWGDSGANSAPTQQSTEAQLKQELAAIFKKIGDRDTCTIGLYELYRITQLYPQVDIFSQLQNASEAFRIYIRDGLAQMAKNAAAGRTPSSVPISTPPPVSSALSSPKVGPPSPINTKLQSVRADNTMPNIQSVHESNDASGGTMPSTMDTIESRKPSQVRSREDQDENCIVRGEVTRVTLDAIRERMKSIQAAAAAGSIESVPFMPYSNVPNPSFSRQENMSTVNPPMDDKALSGLQARMERLKLGNLEPV